MSLQQAPLRIALVYVALGIGWVTLSDWFLARLPADTVRMGQMIKGVLFVFLSGALIYLLIRHELRKRREVEAEREELQSRLSGAQRLEAIGRLTGGIAHDFNNLLTAIRGNIDGYLSRKRKAGAVDPDLVELEEAISSARRAEDLTRQLLAFGRRQRLHPEPLDLNAAIQDMAQLLRRLIGEGVEIRTALAPDLQWITVDRGPLQQVVMNLVINARDAMPDGGRLTLTTRNVRVSSDSARERFDFPIAPGEYVLLRVADTGTGMDAETAAHIYEPFFTTKPKDVGTGLGLSTVFGIVKQSGGYIALDTEPGRGTCFHLYFPAGSGTLEPAEEPEPAEEEPEIEGCETVLVVEDEPAVRSVIVRTLEGHGFNVVERPDGPAALSFLETPGDPPVKLLLTDAHMPGMTGVELIERVRLSRPDLPVLLMSGYAVHELKSEEAYLPKPFTRQQLLSRVRDTLDHAGRS